MIVKNIHRKNWRRILSFSACFLFALTVSVSCKKNPAKFGTDTLSPENLLSSGGIDTFQLSTYSVEEDSLPSDNQRFALVGSMHDPKMGIVNAAFCTQFEFNGHITHPNTAIPIMDSVVLTLKYGGVYGKISQNTYQVFELTEALSIDSTYYKNKDTWCSFTDLVDPSTAVQTANVEDSTLNQSGIKIPPLLKLKLDNSWGYDKVYEAIHGTAFTSDAAFKAYFKGLKVKVQETSPTPGQGAILYFELGNANTKLTFYYKLSGDASMTQYNISTVIGTGCADYNQVSVDNTGYPVADVINNHINGQTQFYTQAFQSRGVVKFPGVSDIPKNSVIHDALLVLPVSYQTGNLYYPSYSADVVIETEDYVAYVGVTYDPTLKRYVVPLTNYIQSIVNGTSDNEGIFINSSYFTSTAERVIFNGAGTAYKAKPKLIVKYTQF